jgi:hypothetical protein
MNFLFRILIIIPLVLLLSCGSWNEDDRRTFEESQAREKRAQILAQIEPLEGRYQGIVHSTNASFQPYAIELQLFILERSSASISDEYSDYIPTLYARFQKVDTYSELEEELFEVGYFASNQQIIFAKDEDFSFEGKINGTAIVGELSGESGVFGNVELVKVSNEVFASSGSFDAQRRKRRYSALKAIEGRYAGIVTPYDLDDRDPFQIHLNLFVVEERMVLLSGQESLKPQLQGKLSFYNLDTDSLNIYLDVTFLPESNELVLRNHSSLASSYAGIGEISMTLKRNDQQLSGVMVDHRGPTGTVLLDKENEN